MSEQFPVLVTDAPALHPIRLVITDDLHRSRLTVFFRLLLVIPHFVWLTLWGITVWFALLAAWLIGVFAGRVPDGLHDFIAAYLRYLTHVSAYYSIAANPYPSFTGAPGCPIDVEIAPAAQQSRLSICGRLVPCPGTSRLFAPQARQRSGRSRDRLRQSPTGFPVERFGTAH